MDKANRKETCEVLLDTMFAIVEQLGGVSDNHTVAVKATEDVNSVNGESFNVFGRLNTLMWLKDEVKAIEFRYEQDNAFVTVGSDGNGYLVSIINRYIFEDTHLALRKIYAKLTDYDGYDKSIDDRTTPYLVYYDTVTGKGLVNGGSVNLEGRNKRLFNELFRAAPKSLSRTALLKIARTGRYKEDGDMYVVSNAFNLLRKACKVKSEVIPLSNGTAKLNASVFPLTAQFPRTLISPPK